MQTTGDIRRDLPPDLDPSESESLVAVALRLQAEAPPPAPAFRGDLRRRLFSSEARRTRLRTASAGRNLALSYIASGLLLLASAAIGLVGAGPFAPG